MNKVKAQPTDVGVIVGRFQTHILHAAHLDLIKSVCADHPKVIIFLGLSPCLVTQNNPLDFESRKKMILESFPEVDVHYIKDQKSDDLWSKNLDRQIADLCPLKSVTLYGGRDSFLRCYNGKHLAVELESDIIISASQLRKEISSKVKGTQDFRAGIIWASNNTYPTCYPTVDIAIFDDKGRVLLGRKDGEKEHRFIGGFADPKSPNYEADARREAMEETGVSVSDPIYIGSRIIDDWRYRKEKDKIKTLLFVAKYESGSPQANDDIAELKWFNWGDIDSTTLVKEHFNLFVMLLEKQEKIAKELQLQNFEFQLTQTISPSVKVVTDH